MRQRVVLFGLICCFVVSGGSGFAQAQYRQPEPDIVELVDAPMPPGISISPRGDKALLQEQSYTIALEELVEPMLKLAGHRILPRFNIPQRRAYVISMTILDLKTGTRTPLQLPSTGRFGAAGWSPDGKRLAVARYRAGGGDVWVFDAVTGRGKSVSPSRLNSVLLSPYTWERGSRYLLVPLFPASRGTPPATPTLPSGPIIQETRGTVSKVRTYQDLLQNEHDEDLFRYYATSQLHRIDLEQNSVTPVGQPVLLDYFSVSPDRSHILVKILTEPFSRIVPSYLFAHTYQLWDTSGAILMTLAENPISDQLPIEGVRKGMRNIGWQPLFPARLYWSEALDDGDPGKDAPFRDKLLVWEAPFIDEPREVFRFPQRYAGISWLASAGLLLGSDYDRNRKWVRTWMFSTESAAEASSAALIFDRSIHNDYTDPGDPVFQTMPDGQSVAILEGDEMFLSGRGATPDGFRPFLQRFSLRTRLTDKLFQCASDCYETFVGFADASRSAIITSWQNSENPLNYCRRELGARATEKVMLTDFPNPAEIFKKVRKELLTYTRRDGVPLSGTLYYPLNFAPEKRFPAVVWAYPLEYTNIDTAGQVRTTTTRYSRISLDSILFFVLRGYAVLDHATIPIVGDPLTANDTFIEQITDGAQAAVDVLVDTGFIDRHRIGIAGHSYGAFMTAHLLAHTDLFAAGIAKSGAYLRALTPFGFQGERRTFWEAPEVYTRLSPFTYADKINEPLLLIHGELDPNPGTYPLQSERLYAAIRGHGGTARFVLLPYENHAYQARASILHTLTEMFEWFDTYVRHAEPRLPQTDQVQPRDPQQAQPSDQQQAPTARQPDGSPRSDDPQPAQQTGLSIELSTDLQPDLPADVLPGMSADLSLDLSTDLSADFPADLPTDFPTDLPADLSTVVPPDLQLDQQTGQSSFDFTATDSALSGQN